jgi:hypothetical protein
MRIQYTVLRMLVTPAVLVRFGGRSCMSWFAMDSELCRRDFQAVGPHLEATRLHHCDVPSNRIYLRAKNLRLACQIPRQYSSILTT